MNKISQKLGSLILTVILALSHSFTVFANFSDVSTHNKYFEAINYLQENNIINGYEDDTFKPFRTVNRAEFLKIIIEGSHIPTEITAKVPFTDVPENVWYTPYIKKAYGEGWINGYSDGTFKPDQTINKVEALKILGKAQSWPIKTTASSQIYSDIDINSWYSGYLEYAKTNNYLEETGDLYEPLNFMTRGQISEIIFRTLTYPAAPSTENEITSSISDNQNYFDNITLTSGLPETFFTNEIFVLSGKTTNNPATGKLHAIIENTNTKSKKTYETETKNNNFSLAITFPESGTYRIGLIPESAESSKALQITVNSQSIVPEKNDAAPNIPTNISLSYNKSITNYNFTGDSTETLKKITFTQGSISKTLFCRQDLNSIPLIYSLFKEFKAGSIKTHIEIANISNTNPVTITSPFSKSEVLTFIATEHTFDMGNSQEITTNAPETKGTLSDITFTGSATTDIQQKAYIIKANGLAETTQLTTSGTTSEYYGTPTIKSGSKFTFNYTPTINGRYIIAIDNKAGEPIFNHPIYIGKSIPLIPDFFDLNEREYFSTTFDLEKSRNELLMLINEARTSHGLATLALSEEINTLAQNHSNDMAENNFFAHVNKNGQTPDARRIAAGIATPVGENIAKDVSIEFAHYSLLRSPSHRMNILKPDWEVVGLGITEKDGYLYITQEFSTNPLTLTDFKNFKTELIESINTKRESNEATQLTYSIPLENAAIYLNDNTKENPENFTQQLFEEALTNNNIQGSSEVTTISAGSWSDTLNSILNNEDSLFSALWELIGIDITTDTEGLLHTIIIINK